MDSLSPTGSEIEIKERRSVSVWTANLVGVPFLFGAIGAFMWLHTQLWGVSALESLVTAAENQLWFWPLFIGGILLHEGIHTLAMRYAAQVPWSEIEGGIKWELLTPYVHTKHVMTAGAYRVVALSPGVVLGLLPAVVGLSIGSLLWTLYGALFVGVAGGDVLSVWRLRGVPATAWVQDASDGCGCEIVEVTADA